MPVHLFKPVSRFGGLVAVLSGVNLVFSPLLYGQVSERFSDRIQAGSNHSAVLNAQGELYSWGHNAHGQLGIGGTGDQASPRFSSVTNLHSIATSADTMLALTQSGSVLGWGLNSHGQLGLGNQNNALSPLALPISDVQQISAGHLHSLALKTDGTVLAWGENASGRLGTGNTVDSLSPVQIPDFGNVAFVSASFYHNLALKNDGTVWSWGSNSFGRLGDGSTSEKRSPVQVHNLSGITYVAAGVHHSLAIDATGNVWSWGWNRYGQLGSGTAVDQALEPIQVASVSSATAIAAGERHSLALLANGDVMAWGDNSFGQLGMPEVNEIATPTRIPELAPVVAIAAGTFHSVMLLQSGELITFGRNVKGQLGTGEAGGYSAVHHSALEDVIDEVPLPATTCAAIKQNQPSSPSGMYTIDPDGSGGVAPFQAYCDMVTQGGGWTLYANHRDGIEDIVPSLPVTPNAFSVLPATQWQLLRDSMSDGMMFIDENGLVSRISKAKLNAGNCRATHSVHSLEDIPSIGGYSTIWHQENSGCSITGLDYSIIILTGSRGFSYAVAGASLYQQSGVKFDVWPYDVNWSSQSQDQLQYFIK